MRFFNGTVGLVSLLLLTAPAWAVWDSTKPAQTQTVSQGSDSTQQNFAARALGTASLAALGLIESSPSLEFCDSSDDTAYLWHVDTSATDPWRNFQLWRGTCTGGLGNFAVSPDSPLMYFDNDNKVHFPYGIVATDAFDVSVRATNSANESIGDSTNTDLTFNGENYDTDTMHSTTTNTNRLTINTTGKYLFIGNVDWDASATGYRELRILVNGTTIIGSNGVPGSATAAANRQTVVAEYTMAATDYVTLNVRQTSGGALNVLFNQDFSP